MTMIKAIYATHRKRDHSKPILEILSTVPEVSSGIGHTPEVLFIAGAAHTASCWYFFQSYLAQMGIRSHAFNFRGHGNSSQREHLLTNRLQDYVDDLEQVVQTLGLHKKSYVLVAHSMGGYVAQVYLHQKNLQGLVGVVLMATATPRLSRKTVMPLDTMPIVV